MRAVIIFFAKAPNSGNVKTRLVPPLTHLQAVELHTAFVSDLLTRFQQLAHVDVELHTDVLSDAWIDCPVTRKLQISGCLGLRMFHALEEASVRGYERTLILGTDAPTVPTTHVQSLLSAASDVALGPADDGGFWGISTSKTKPNMFDNVQWSSDETLEQTIGAIEAAGLSVEIGPTWFDVDVVADLARLLTASNLPPATRLWMERHANFIAALKATR